MECFLQCLLNGCLDYSWQGAAVNSRFRNAGLCFQNLNSGPGRPVWGGSGGAGLPTALVDRERCWPEGWSEGFWIVG